MVSKLLEIWSGLFTRIQIPDPDFLPSLGPGSRGQKGTGSATLEKNYSNRDIFSENLFLLVVLLRNTFLDSGFGIGQDQRWSLKIYQFLIRSKYICLQQIFFFLLSFQRHWDFGAHYGKRDHVCTFFGQYWCRVLGSGSELEKRKFYVHLFPGISESGPAILLALVSHYKLYRYSRPLTTSC